MEAPQRSLVIVHTASTCRNGLEQAYGMIDQDTDYYYDQLLNSLANFPPSAPELKEVGPLVGYLARHDGVVPEAQIYLAAYWERAVRLRNRLGKVSLFDTHITRTDGVDERTQVS